MAKFWTLFFSLPFETATVFNGLLVFIEPTSLPTTEFQVVLNLV